jgi:hypothetical protein
MKKNILVVTILMVVVGVGGFFAGMKYQQSRRPSRGGFQATRGTRQGFPGGPQAGTEAVRGEVISQEEGNITVKLADESSKIVLISENTEINKATEGSIDDLKSGEQVMVFGKTNADGSLSASQIQLNFDMGRR